ncbi:pyridoxal-dependent decarboxylase, exosortase A system-associated [Parahaliea sp. F7430]|uniref:Pyridoxal-dependent decarboxylase, exosortase A system-associated n=1 Tax=Sediminihaliea albiluteola TaxID=2758564 RepID=A0A7W2TVE9_9GAMM|nr:pyridoxal-dependent decarboxylase, exosortase A system-associated [Sediminihaliea albiluteola]MBA6412680.1 pyridoxal-dependent decarboxylase, exosortase A system-associated [Sediminihaliea albiluteola]
MTVKSAPRHAEMRQFSQRDNELIVGDLSLSTLAARVGSTPFYAYDRALVEARVATFRQLMPASLQLHYAVKANPMPAVIQCLAGLTDGLDVASAGEMQLALDCGLAPERISFAGPGKSDSELRRAAAAGVVINLESEGELRRLAVLAEELGCNPKVAVRVNPAFELKASGMQMGGGPKPFGVDQERVPAMLEELGQIGLDFQGFHIFSGSQNLRAEAIIESQNKTLELAINLAEYAPSKLRTLNIGGGLGVPYFPGELPLELDRIAENLDQLIALAKSALPGTELIMELGRYLVAEAGIYVAEVIDRKESRGTTYLVTNGGLHHHLAASGNFGQVIRKNYPVCLGNRLASEELEEVTIVGPLCTPLDILASKVILPKAQPGDLVVVYQSGAYGYSASPHLFLGHPAPQQVLV